MRIGRAACAVLLIAPLALTACAQATAEPDQAGPGYPPVCLTGLPAEPDGPVLAGQGVGAGVLVYRSAGEPGRDAWLLTENGRFVKLPPVPVPPPPATPDPQSSLLPGATAEPQKPLDPMFGVHLSPDGRWLSRPSVAFGSTLRDLTGETVVRLPGVFDPGQWSSNSRWLTTRPLSPGGSSAYERHEVATGEKIEVRLPDRNGEAWQVIGVRDDGTLVMTRMWDGENRDPDPRHESYSIVDPVTGAEVHRTTIDFGDDSTGPFGLVVDSTMFSGSNTGTGAVTAWDLRTGRQLWRHSYQAESPLDYQFWGMGGVSGSSVTVIRNHSMGSPSFADEIEVHRLRRTDGAASLACLLPPNAELVLPGGR
ncbi:hypothetical protein F4553_000477 [Allocatelliglobosispora scoriae]|uniref:Uncharacterized protein n=1 Tax=Allocatelliglobosispora scoriae TaxID=643052 RepID=A0A841BIE7_9ACTN|nr:hypothetical protein [Allocatelliglobosispora scoriae]MBB5867098.1 hypothetical protein [Allocatelliglobosispora scoriae]